MQLLPTNQEDKRTMSSHVYDKVDTEKLTLADIYGQDVACKRIATAMTGKQFPEGLLFYSDTPGVGKTLMAHVVKNIMRASLGGKHLQHNFINGRDLKADDVRSLLAKYEPRGFVNDPKLLVVNEAHGMSLPASEAFLAFMDTAYNGVNPHKTTVVFTTTDLSALRSGTAKGTSTALVSRFVSIHFKPFDKQNMKVAINDALKHNGATLPQNIIDRVVVYANGSLRRALKALTELHGVTDKSVIDAVLNSAESEENPIMPVITQYIFMPNTRRENWEKIMQHRISGGTLSELRMPIIAMTTNALAGKAKATEFSVTNKKVLAGDTAVINMLSNLITDLSQYSDIPVISEGQIIAALSRLMVK
jgi:DNA polymerase III delta prime subunit